MIYQLETNIYSKKTGQIAVASNSYDDQRSVRDATKTELKSQDGLGVSKYVENKLLLDF